MCPLSQSSCCTLLTVMQWPLLNSTLVPHEGKSWQSECEKAIPEWAPFHPSNWLAMGHTSKANIPEISEFYPSCHHVVGQWITTCLSLCCRCGLLAYVYTGVSVSSKCLSGGKVALIYYGSVALTFTVWHFRLEQDYFSLETKANISKQLKFPFKRTGCSTLFLVSKNNVRPQLDFLGDIALLGKYVQ